MPTTGLLSPVALSMPIELLKQIAEQLEVEVDSRGAYHRFVEIESGSARHADRATQADRRAARSRSRLKDKDHMTTSAGPRLTSEQSTELFKPLCAITPEYFQAVGQFYEDFSQTTEEEVRELVARAAQRS